MSRPVIDGRADSTADNKGDQGALADVLASIALEEQREDEAIAAKVARDATAEAEAALAELVSGWETAVSHGADILTSAFPALLPVWTKPRCDGLAAALARCDEHYGWGGAGALLGHPLLGLAVASAPLAIGTVQVIKVEKMKAEAAKLAANNAASDARSPGGQGDKASAIDAAVAADTAAA
ncbi:hypothetical protein [Burkholderia gladioli]|uniref:hypothetical protein n=1 Tax=Burkholderia gladioli TaxID=28095 RepID=UPI0016424272|nr:hypothetical protein [Burkholderia gladioli]